MDGDLRPAKAYLLPDELRTEVGRAFGPIVSTEELKDAVGGAPLLCVGDQVSLTAKQVGLTPRVIVCDFRTRRGAPSATYRDALGSWGNAEFRIRNPPATLTREAWDAVRTALALPGPGPARILVQGEEDLLGIPCFLEAPDGSVVVYGMPGKGVVVVKVDARLKTQVRRLVQRFRQAR